MLSAGDTVRNYQIVAQLTTGGMGTLFVGRRVGVAGFAQPVAIKVIHPHLWYETRFREAFIDEALLASRISHPNVVRVDELGEERGIYFLAMEYVHGCSLAELLQTLVQNRRGLAVPVSTAIAIRVADGLHAAHQLTDDQDRPLGLVHRDVSPQNVLMGFGGQVKLCDFGIAKARSSRSGTGVGSLKGKIRYMSPEQAHGWPLDHRSDVYALGLVLWEMLTRRRAFRKTEDLAVLEDVRNPHLPPPSTLARGISPELDRVVQRALAKDAASRFGSALDFARALGTAVPEAHRVDGARLAELLQLALGDKIRKRTAQLPSVLRGAFTTPSAIDAERDFAVGALTVSVAEEVVSDEARAFSEEFGSGSVPECPEIQGSLVGAARPRSRNTWVAVAVLSMIAAVILAAAIRGDRDLPVQVIEPSLAGDQETETRETPPVVSPPAPPSLESNPEAGPSAETKGSQAPPKRSKSHPKPTSGRRDSGDPRARTPAVRSTQTTGPSAGTHGSQAPPKRLKSHPKPTSSRRDSGDPRARTPAVRSTQTVPPPPPTPTDFGGVPILEEPDF